MTTRVGVTVQEPLQLELEAFITVARGGRSSPVGGAEAVRKLEATEWIRRGAQAGAAAVALEPLAFRRLVG
jgi:hypothetical protein